MLSVLVVVILEYPEQSFNLVVWASKRTTKATSCQTTERPAADKAWRITAYMTSAAGAAAETVVASQVIERYPTRALEMMFQPVVFSMHPGKISQHIEYTLRQSNIAMENGPFEDVVPIKNGDIPLLC